MTKDFLPFLNQFGELSPQDIIVLEYLFELMYQEKHENIYLPSSTEQERNQAIDDTSGGLLSSNEN